MNISQGSFVNSEIKFNQNLRTKVSFKEFIFNDLVTSGSFLFKDMKLEIYKNGQWHFYMTAEGNNATTILKNGRKSGPVLSVLFKDSTGNIIYKESLGQINYHCHNDDMANAYVCKGAIEDSEAVDSVEINYDAFLDFACRRN